MIVDDDEVRPGPDRSGCHDGQADDGIIDPKDVDVILDYLGSVKGEK